MSFRTNNRVPHFHPPSPRWVPRWLLLSIVYLVVCGVSLQFGTGAIFASSSPILVVNPSSFNGNTDCSYTLGQGWTCTATLSRGDQLQQNLIWSAHGSGVRGISFNPQGGNLAPGTTQSVTITVPDIVCPMRATLSFKGPGNTVQVPWSCAGPLLTVDTTNFTAGGNCPVGQGGWTCSTNVGESSSSQGSLNWSAKTSLSGVTFTPASGMLSPGGSTAVSIFVPTSDCKNANFNFIGKNSNTVHALWNCQGHKPPPPPPVLTVSPTTLYPTNCTLNGGSEQCTVSFGETSNSKGNVTWSANSSLSGVTFTPSKGTLSPGETITVTISGIPCQNGTFTFSGNKGATPVSVSWNCTTPPVLTVTPTSLDPKSSNCTGGGNPQCTVTLGETPDSQGSLTWSAGSDLNGVTFTPQTGTLLQGATEQVTISKISCKSGTFTFTGPANAVSVSWSCTLPPGTITEYPIPTSNSAPYGITRGPDGNLWFTEQSANQIGKFNPATSVFTEYVVPTANSVLVRITDGPDGNLWFVELSGNKIGKINPANGAITEYPIPTAYSTPLDITAGPDGNLWFTEQSANQVGKFNPATNVFNEYPVPTANGTPVFITAGADGNLWFTEINGNKIGKIDPATGTISEYAVPTANSEPGNVTSGPDGNLWFTEITGNKIGQINPTNGVITEFPIPTANSQPSGIAAGSDGNIWFTEKDGNQVGQINLATGVITEYAVPTANSKPENITPGPDGNLWFVEGSGNQVGQIIV